MGGRGTVEHLRGMHVIRTGMQMGERERERERERKGGASACYIDFPTFSPFLFGSRVTPGGRGRGIFVLGGVFEEKMMEAELTYLWRPSKNELLPPTEYEADRGGEGSK